MAALELTSTAFDDGRGIPEKYSCDGESVSPPLAWSTPPEGTRSLALIVHDPDAPSGDFTHWLAWNIDPQSRGLDEGAPAPAEGANGRGQNRWQGPCPPPGNPPHHYVFTLTALSRPLGLGAGATAPQVKVAMSGLIVGQAVLIGRFGR